MSYGCFMGSSECVIMHCKKCEWKQNNRQKDNTNNKKQKNTINYSSCYAHKRTTNNRRLVNHYIFNLVIYASFTPLPKCNMNTIYDQTHNTTRLPTLK